MSHLSAEDIAARLEGKEDPQAEQHFATCAPSMIAPSIKPISSASRVKPAGCHRPRMNGRQPSV